MTYSIVARCPDTGRLGAAIASQVLGAGRVLFGEAGVGVVATQGVVLAAHGPRILQALETGDDAATAMAASLAADDDAALRQVAVVDVAGQVAVHTGDHCIAHAGHVAGDGWVAQSNVAADPSVWSTMGHAFARDEGPLEQRLLTALDAAEEAGGDFRGRQSAAVLVLTPTPSGDLLADRVIDVRVDDHDEPLRELRRIVEVASAVHELERAEDALGRGDLQEAVARSHEVLAAHPGHVSYLFSYAMTLTAAGEIDEARDHLRRATVATGDDRWRVLLQRVGEAGIVDADAVSRVLAPLSGPE